MYDDFSVSLDDVVSHDDASKQYAHIRRLLHLFDGSSSVKLNVPFVYAKYKPRESFIIAVSFLSLS